MEGCRNQPPHGHSHRRTNFMKVWLVITLIHLGSGVSQTEEFLVPTMKDCEEMIVIAREKVKEQTGLHLEGQCFEEKI